VITPLVLIGYAITVSTLGSAMLRRAVWPSRSPRLGIATWQALVLSGISAVVLAGSALALPVLPFTTDLADLLQACATSLQSRYATPAGAGLSTAGLMLAAGVLARGAYCLVSGVFVADQTRRRQLNALCLVAHRHRRSGALVLDHPTALAYCRPGRRREIVLTTGALAALSENEIQAVLAHEQAHLNGRHDLVLAAFEAMERAFPGVSMLRYARQEGAMLVEMLADDAAASGHSERLDLATALVHLAAGRAPASTLGAGGDTTVARVQRLLNPPNPVRRSRAAAILSVTGMLVLLPGALISAPALTLVAATYCTI